MNSLNELNSYILHEIKTSEIPYEDIAIIGPVKKGNFDAWGDHKNYGLQIIANLLSQNDIHYESHYSFTDNDATSKRVSNIKEGHINLYTIHEKPHFFPTYLLLFYSPCTK